MGFHKMLEQELRQYGGADREIVEILAHTYVSSLKDAPNHVQHKVAKETGRMFRLGLAGEWDEIWETVGRPLPNVAYHPSQDEYFLAAHDAGWRRRLALRSARRLPAQDTYWGTDLRFDSDIGRQL